MNSTDWDYRDNLVVVYQVIVYYSRLHFGGVESSRLYLSSHLEQVATPALDEQVSHLLGQSVTKVIEINDNS